MHRSLRFAAGASIGALATLAFGTPLAGARTTAAAGTAGAVYAQTNAPRGNHVLTYSRGTDGTLHAAGSYATRGLGGKEAGAVVDPLASQGSVTYDAAQHLLFVTNAGSSQLSVFSAHGTTLALRQVIGTEGSFPTSVTVWGNNVYVLDAGNQGAVVGFRMSSGRLERIANSKRVLNLGNTNPPNYLMAPGQVGFTPDGKHVVVTTKAHGTIDVFGVNANGALSAAPVQNTPAGMVPFAFSFDASGRLVVVEAGTSSVSTYRVATNGTLSTVSGPVGDGEAAACWIATASGGNYFVANAGSNSISSYQVAANGSVSLSHTTATTSGGPIDLVTAPGGHFLYSENGGAGTIDEFAVHGGSLTRIGTVHGLSGGTVEGLTAV
ncbi:MAG TPA: beta-propeller fold lactonase family protein [Acidimicrobiia bacterium]|jgi:DNA-binding beta-propeller fold protein YncE